MDSELTRDLRARRDALPEGDDLVAFTDDVPLKLLQHSYPLGIFPWPYEEHQPVPWVWPSERAVLHFDRFRLGKSSQRAIRRGAFEIRFNTAFSDVIEACATVPGRETWIFPFMREAYAEAHHAGLAESVEVFQAGELVGGLYGIRSPGFFSGESMFHRVDAAGKAAVQAMVGYLQAQGCAWMDIQQISPHMEAMGACAIDRKAFSLLIDQAALNATA